jgi:hypothetical protein
MIERLEEKQRVMYVSAQKKFLCIASFVFLFLVDLSRHFFEGMRGFGTLGLYV